MRSPGWRVVLRGCPWPAAPVPSGVPAIQSLECGVWVLGGLADGKNSIHAGLCWGLPRLGGRGCRCPPTEGPVAQLGVGHVLGICRCSSLTVPLPVVFGWSVQQCPRRGGTRGGHPPPHSRSGVVDLGVGLLLGGSMLPVLLEGDGETETAPPRSRSPPAVSVPLRGPLGALS